jgi:putative ABC transport system ATP-binding protein
VSTAARRTRDAPALMELRAASKIYGEGHAAVHALREVDLRIEAGEFVAVMGPSGSGKSTCLNVLGCLDTPTRGEYRFEGIDVGALLRDQRALLRRHYLGFVFQGFNLLARASASENVELPLVYRGVATAERRRLAQEALEQVGLRGWEHHAPSELSGGQQQRVAIARAMVSRPAVLLADEPTGNLDTATSRGIMDLIETLNRETKVTVVMVTHEREVADRARRVVHFLDGRIERDHRSARHAGEGVGGGAEG